MMHDRYTGEPTPACRYCSTPTTVPNLINGACPTCNRRKRQMIQHGATDEEIEAALTQDRR